MLKIPPRIVQVKENAKNAMRLTNLGTTKEMIDAHATQLEDCIYHPTTGLLARNKYCKPENIFHNSITPRRRNLENSPMIKYLNGILQDRMKSLYPKTRKLREYIIDERRISLDSIRPCRGYSFIDKLKILFR
ncbi:MAG: hypothetical protein NC191_03425 [Muribaculaceae bacterium]|nr:hypothetical protein [Muribaculaceae bacterium]